MKNQIFGLLLFLAIVLAIILVCKSISAVTLEKWTDWTAPADNYGIGGQVTAYDMRYSTDPDSLADHFTACPQIPTPTPGQPFDIDSAFIQLEILPETWYYFAIKSVDKFNNWSEISNLDSILIRDTLAPAAILNFKMRP